MRKITNITIGCCISGALLLSGCSSVKADKEGVFTSNNAESLDKKLKNKTYMSKM